MLFTLQRYEFFSKSQHDLFSQERLNDVVYLAKVRIFQQITTLLLPLMEVPTMLFTLQRYEFFSKSQHPVSLKCRWLRCCLPCKGTNFLANHNPPGLEVNSYPDVVYLAKVRIFQQITTLLLNISINHVMLFTLQRYEFFSKSQLVVWFTAAKD